MKKPSDTRQKLLDVAFDLIWDNSYGSVSVDDICQRAGVNKGSFYHFFESKAELAVEAYQEQWQKVRPEFDSIFSPLNPPLERLKGWCKHVVETQREKASEYGRVCGCPYASIGAEIATKDEKMRVKCEQIMLSARKYLESAIADSVREGSCEAGDPVTTANRVYSVCLGMLVEARVQNDLELLRDLEPAILNIVGVRHAALGAV